MNYIHLIKPMALLDQLEKGTAEAYILLDTDTYIMPGFLDEVNASLANGIGMNFFVRKNPYPEFSHSGFFMPDGKFYQYSSTQSLMYNSGVIAIKKTDRKIIEDTIFLIHKLLGEKLEKFDIEQFALSEAIILNKNNVIPIYKSIHHYHSRWKRRYIHWCLSHKNLGEFQNLKIGRPFVKPTKNIVRIFKFISLLKSSLNRLRII